MSVNSKMTAIADPIRNLTGQTGKMGLDAMASNLDEVVNECDTQADLIAQIKTALVDKAAGGVTLPTLTNPGSAEDLAAGKQLIGADGSVVEGSLLDLNVYYFDEEPSTCELSPNGRFLIVNTLPFGQRVIMNLGATVTAILPMSNFGNAGPEDVRAGVTFTSKNGLEVEGTAAIGGGYAIKTGTTTSRTIDTGLSDVEQFFMYKESQTGTGLIHLHYTKTATSRMYASAWSTQNYGTKAITNGTGGVTVTGGTVTISATQATQGALTSNVSYKWVAVGKE